MSYLDSVEELSKNENRLPLELSLGGMSCQVGFEKDEEATQWFEAFSLVIKYLVWGGEETEPEPKKEGLVQIKINEVSSQSVADLIEKKKKRNEKKEETRLLKSKF